MSVNPDSEPKTMTGNGGMAPAVVAAVPMMIPVRLISRAGGAEKDISSNSLYRTGIKKAIQKLLWMKRLSFRQAILFSKFLYLLQSPHPLIAFTLAKICSRVSALLSVKLKGDFVKGWK